MHRYDSVLLKQATRLHKFLAQQGGYPVLLSTGLCGALFAGRVYLSRTLIFLFLFWNLFLAWIPYLCSLWAVYWHQRYPRRWWLLLLPGLVGIAFFPNAPYIVTDFLHLGERPPVPLWYDVGLLACCAWTGIVLGIYALRLLQEIVRAWVGTILSWIFVLVVIGLSGVGIYVGRFLRWNTWDLLVQPQAVFYDILVRLRHPLGYPKTYGVTLLYAALIFVCYLALTIGPHRSGQS